MLRRNKNRSVTRNTVGLLGHKCSYQPSIRRKVALETILQLAVNRGTATLKKRGSYQKVEMLHRDARREASNKRYGYYRSVMP